MNLFVGFFLFAMVFWVYGETRLNPSKMPYGMHFSDSSLLDEGLRQGDLIVALDGEPVQDYASIGRELLLEDVGQMQVLRDGESLSFEVTELFRNKVLRASGNGPFLEPRLPAVIDTVLPETPAALAGIQRRSNCAIGQYLHRKFPRFSSRDRSASQNRICIGVVACCRYLGNANHHQ